MKKTTHNSKRINNILIDIKSSTRYGKNLNFLLKYHKHESNKIKGGL